LKSKERRVVVTGLGLVTPLGVNVHTTWNNLIQGKCGVTQITKFDVSNLPVKIGATVQRGSGENEFDTSKWIPKDIRSTVAPFMEFAIASSAQAIEDAKWKPTTEEEKERTVNFAALYYLIFT
jgi:3-oxoacyl-[acyl-carrier-protein] synthase II